MVSFALRIARTALRCRPHHNRQVDPIDRKPSMESLPPGATTHIYLPSSTMVLLALDFPPLAPLPILWTITNNELHGISYGTIYC